MVSGRQDYSAHRLRIQGFREVLSQRFPHLQLSDVLAGEERREQITRRWSKPCAAAGILLGSITPGLAIPRLPRRWPATAAKATSAGSPMSVTTPPGSSWRRAAALTLDQNTRQHAQLAIDLMLRHLESGYQPQTYADGKVDFILYSAENVD
nr:Uncharacterised protein [Klebsiella pneumoniae]